MATSTEYPDLNTVYPSETAPPPAPSEYPTLDEVYGSSAPNIPSQPPQGVMGAVGAALQAQPGMMADAMTNPVTQAHALPILAGAVSPMIGIPSSAGVAGGNALADAALASYGRSDQIPSAIQQGSQIAGAVAADLAEPVTALFKTPASLKSAGVSATTLEHMAPNGQPPGDWVNAVQNQFKDEGVLANTANATWKLMSKKTNQVGQAISGIMQKIGTASPEALQVDAQTALKPIADKIQQLGGNMYSEAQTVAEPFQQAHDFLAKTAQQQGGKLTLQNIDTALQQTGDMMNGGQQAIEKYGPVYGRLADVRDTIVQNVANQTGDSNLASDLLKNNAQYSSYMRVLPSVEKSAYKEAVKEGVSAYQKHIGPLGEKMAIAGGSYAAVRAAMDKVLGTGQ